MPSSLHAKGETPPDDAGRWRARLEHLQAVTSALATVLTPAGLAEVMVEHGRAALGAPRASVFMADESGTGFDLFAQRGLGDEVAAEAEKAGIHAGSAAAICLRDAVAVFVESREEYQARFPESWRTWSPRVDTRAFVCLPLMRHDEAVGVFSASFSEDRTFPAEDRRMLEAMAQQCGQALERTSLFEAERQARQQAEAATRLRDEFLATVSHELRTPLTAILGWAQLLKRGAVSAERLAKAIDTIERNAHAQARLIEDLLDVSRIIAGQLRLANHPVDVGAVVESAADTVRPAARAKGVAIVIAVDAALGTIAGDADRLVQVVWNLLSNAVRFTPSGGEVEVRATRAGAEVAIVVRDTGEGIPLPFLPFVFERFRQADGGPRRVHGGLGIGLAIVRHLVEMHGGTVTAESEGPGRGATFTVRLPTRAEAPAADEATPARALAAAAPIDAAPPLRGTRVLVVDDEDDARDLVTAILEQHGAAVATARGAGEALAALGRVRPDVLVSDIGMPGEDGYDLIATVRALGPGEPLAMIPAVALTAYARVEDRRRALAAGFQAHVPKPIKPADLVAAIARAVG